MTAADSDRAGGRSLGRRTVIALVGALAGAAGVLNLLSWRSATSDIGGLPGLAVAGIAAVGAVIGAAVMLGLAGLTHRLSSGMEPARRRRLLRYDPWTYLPSLLLGLGAFGLQLPWLVVLAVSLVAAKAAAMLLAVAPDRRRAALRGHGYLAFLFLLSGIAAMIYQIVWQRTLFTAFGVNIESITIIVSLFMFGLGVGALFGGRLIRRYPDSGPVLFLVCEWGIGLFGLISIPLIQAVASMTLHARPLVVGLVVFALLAVPTVLMGATLPILVGHLHRLLLNVGRSVGLLYCINTAGSAIACFLAVDVLFVLLGQQASVRIAAVCNLLVGLLVWRYARSQADGAAARPIEAGDAGPAPSAAGPVGRAARWRGPLLAVLAGAVGYISLSQEIVWMRVMSYMTGGHPAVFAYVLGWFLIGVSGGALLGKWACQRNFRSMGGTALRYAAGMLLIAGMFYYASIRITAGLNDWSHTVGLLATQGAVAVVAFLLGGIFPVLCHHAATPGQSVGMTVSKLYAANIVGSTAGPLVTGFVLMDHFGSDQIILGVSIATLAAGAVTMLAVSPRRGLVAAAAVAGLSVALVAAHGRAYGRFFDKLHRGTLAGGYKVVLENRSGVIAVEPRDTGDIVYGGGAYDGRFTTDPVKDTNRIRRCYMLAALHPRPRRVLEVGLSSGSWALVLSHYAPIEQLVVVEINPGYLDLIPRYPTHKPLLDDPKVTIHIDDGRRWLNRHPDEAFDVIVQNTTWHRRSQVTHLVSIEYLRLCKARLKPGGVVYWNATGNENIPYTAAQVFEHVTRVDNFVAASDGPFDLTEQLIRANLQQFSVHGQPVLNASEATRAVLDQLIAADLPELGPAYRSRAGLEAITDDNMYTEYKLARWYDPARSWAAIWGRGR